MIQQGPSCSATAAGSLLAHASGAHAFSRTEAPGLGSVVRSRRAPLLGCATLLVFSLGACASGPTPDSRRANDLLDGGMVVLAPAGLLFASFDRDGSAQVDREELAAGIAASFGRADTDGNGSLRRLELDDWRAAVLGDVGRTPAGSAFDVDFDGLISRQEFERALSDAASRIDANQDGRLDFAELAFSRGLLEPAERPRNELTQVRRRPPQ